MLECSIVWVVVRPVSATQIPRWPWKPGRHECWLFITSLLGRNIAERDLPGDLAMGHDLWLPQMRCLDFCSFEYHCKYHFQCGQRNDLPGRVHISASPWGFWGRCKFSPTRHAANVVFPDTENTRTRTTYQQGYISVTLKHTHTHIYIYIICTYVI